MERFESFNTRLYKDQLSPFGQNVFECLIKYQCKLDPRKRHELPRPRRQKVLIFGGNDENVIKRNCRNVPSTDGPNECLDLTSIDEVYSSEHYNKIMNNDLSDTDITSVDKSYNINNNASLSREDLITTVIEPNLALPTNILDRVYNNEDEDEYNLPLNSNVARNKPGKITWDNMFDSEILPNITDDEVIREKVVDVKKWAPSPIDVISADVDNIKNNVCLVKNNKIVQNKQLNVQKKKLTKRKYQQTKITDIINKKVKNLSDADAKIGKGNDFRKQKYTKMVQNWLENFDAANENVDSNELNEGSNIKPKTIRVVQTQLGNKDGVMKFNIPKKDFDKQVNNVIEIQKKGKSKFTAPIKSEIPVRNVTYDIVCVGKHNISDMSFADIKDIILVLTYRFKCNINKICSSNGFCQLNCQYTEDSCTPDGIMMHALNTQKYFYWNHEQFIGCHEIEHVMKDIIDNSNVICYDGKYVLLYLAKHFNLKFPDLKINFMDVKIGSCLIDSDTNLESLADVQNILSYTPEYTVATECYLQKTAWYMTVLERCTEKLKLDLHSESLWDLFVNVEMRLLPIVAEMEQRGVLVDVDNLKHIEKVLLNEMEVVEQECYKAAGKTFQINSAAQVGKILYDELKLDAKCNVKIKETLCRGAKSTSEPMLRSLISVHSLPKLILEYRHLHKTHATFLAGISQHIQDGVVRPTWVQIASATGRMASNNPNLQAIPKTPFPITLFPEPTTTGTPTSAGAGAVSPRALYTARARRSLVAADFRHVEVRVFARAAADRALLALLADDGDFFRLMAAKWLHKEEPAAAVSAAERERAKRLVYARLYGAGAGRLADILGAPPARTLDVLADFDRTFPSLKRFGRRVAARGGRVRSAAGRRAPPARAPAPAAAAERARAQRQAVNFIVQGSAADLCKMAMITTNENLRNAYPPVDAHLVLQIHDELVWEIPDEQVDAAAEIIKNSMENCGREYGMDMLLPVTISCGKNWGCMTAIS